MRWEGEGAAAAVLWTEQATHWGDTGQGRFSAPPYRDGQAQNSPRRAPPVLPAPLPPCTRSTARKLHARAASRAPRALRLARHDVSVAELKLLNRSVKELRNAWRVFHPFTNRRKVAVYGSARTHPDHPLYAMARELGEALARYVNSQVGNKLIVCTPSNRVFAINAATGKGEWEFDAKSDTNLTPNERIACRGVAYWKDPVAPPQSECAERILLATFDRRLIAIDLANGKACSTTPMLPPWAM